jgi:hypothetical protein
VVAPCHAVIIKKKVVQNCGKIKVKTEKCANVGKMYRKNNSNYLNLVKQIFVLQFTVILYC